MSPYAYPPPAPYPPPEPPPLPPNAGHVHDGEVIGDFAAVGALAAIDILIRQDVQNGSFGTLLVVGGLAGGAGGGWLVTEKYPVDAGSAHATTLGLLAGAANAALLIEPTASYEPADVIGILFLGSALGAGAGFAYGQASDLTSGQSIFIGDAVLLGSATAALGAIAGSRDGSFGNWENGTLAIGLDAGLVAGALIAPRLDWSARRAKTVLAATAIGALVGGALPGLVTKRDPGEDYNGDLIAGFMTAGLWGGFALGIVTTGNSPPDPKYNSPTKTTTATSVAPWVGPTGQMGVMAGGVW
jgi:hypothetical protein